jgi:hypothetical protein
VAVWSEEDMLHSHLNNYWWWWWPVGTVTS